VIRFFVDFCSNFTRKLSNRLVVVGWLVGWLVGGGAAPPQAPAELPARPGGPISLASSTDGGEV